MIDQTDSRLMKALQENAHLTSFELGAILHLSASQAGRRRQRLEAGGYIKDYRAKLNPRKLGLLVEAFIQITTATHDPKTASEFKDHLQKQPNVTDVWTLTGEADFLLRVYCADLSALNDVVHNVLLPHPAVARVHSQIVMDKIKTDAPLPVASV